MVRGILPQSEVAGSDSVVTDKCAPGAPRADCHNHAMLDTPADRARWPSGCGPATHDRRVIGRRAPPRSRQSRCARPSTSGRLRSMILWGRRASARRRWPGSSPMRSMRFIAISAVLGGVKDIRGRSARPASGARRAAATVVFVDEVHRSTRRSRTPSCRTSESGCSPSSARRPRTVVRGQLGAAVARDRARCCLARRGRTAPGARPRAGLARRAAARRRGGAAPDRLRRRRRARRLVNTLENGPPLVGDATVIDEALLSTLNDSCAASTRAANGSTTPSRRCTRRCAARTPMRRCTGSCACSTAASTRATPPGAWCAWRANTSASRTRARCAWRLRRRPTAPRIAEGELALAQAVVYLAIAPKSTPIYAAYNAAANFIARDGTRPVPLHLRNAPTRLMKDLGWPRLPLRARRGRRLCRRRCATRPTPRCPLLPTGGARARDPHRRESK